ncbi:MAG TPA: hypothetical protein VNE21_08635 [Mycobacteriales bacterium]|nr:hypothetical protein [Mycobacteriales bacterium]
MVGTRSLDEQLTHVTDRLVADLAGRASAPDVRGQVARVLDELGRPRVTQFVAVLVDRQVREYFRIER